MIEIDTSSLPVTNTMEWNSKERWYNAENLILYSTNTNASITNAFIQNSLLPPHFSKRLFHWDGGTDDFEWGMASRLLSWRYSSLTTPNVDDMSLIHPPLKYLKVSSKGFRSRLVHYNIEIKSGILFSSHACVIVALLLVVESW